MTAECLIDMTSDVLVLRASRTKWVLVLLVFAIAITLVLYALQSIWIPAAVTPLDVGVPPKHADVIVLLGGGGVGDRVLTGAQLYDQGLAPRLLITGEPPNAENRFAAATLHDRLTNLGVPASAILVNPDATSTWDEAVAVLARLDDVGARSALIVTNAFHTRRARATFRQVQRSTAIDLAFVDVPGTPRFDNLGREYVATLYYIVWYGVLPFDSTTVAR